jgi:hypothetical protein
MIVVKSLVLVTALLISACAGETSSFELRNPEVELDAFSGRPNPRWTPTASERNALGARLRALPATTRRVRAGGLGFRGFYIHDAGLRIQVSQGRVVIERANGELETFEDRHGLLNLLIEQASQRGYGGIVSRN